MSGGETALLIGCRSPLITGSGNSSDSVGTDSGGVSPPEVTVVSDDMSKNVYNDYSETNTIWYGWKSTKRIETNAVYHQSGPKIDKNVLNTHSLAKHTTCSKTVGQSNSQYETSDKQNIKRIKLNIRIIKQRSEETKVNANIRMKMVNM